jgi:hypothetical protein
MHQVTEFVDRCPAFGEFAFRSARIDDQLHRVALAARRFAAEYGAGLQEGGESEGQTGVVDRHD